jgi:nucleotide-binding universal stress UspA family protein
MFKTLLWATDGSPEAEAAVQFALPLLDDDGRLVAFHCDQRLAGSRIAGEPVLPDEPERRARIEAQVASLREEGVDAELRIATSRSEPAAEINAAAAEVEVDAIVCGTRSLHGLPGLLNGSVSARVLRHAEVPVIVVPARGRR